MLFNVLMHCRSVDWAAHMGGLVAGVLVGIPIFALHIESMVWRILWVVMGTCATVMCFVWSLMYMYSGAIEPAEELRDVCGYYKVRRRPVCVILVATERIARSTVASILPRNFSKIMSARAQGSRLLDGCFVVCNGNSFINKSFGVITCSFFAGIISSNGLIFGTTPKV
jgi:hypothetical protein